MFGSPLAEGRELKFVYAINNMGELTVAPRGGAGIEMKTRMLSARRTGSPLAEGRELK